MVTTSGIVDLRLGWSPEPGYFEAAWTETCGTETEMSFLVDGSPWINIVEQWAQNNPCTCKMHAKGTN